MLFVSHFSFFFCSNNTHVFHYREPKFKPTPSGKCKHNLLSLCKNRCSCLCHSVLLFVICVQMLTCVIAQSLEVSGSAFFIIWWLCLVELWRLTVGLIAPRNGRKANRRDHQSFTVGPEKKHGKHVGTFCSRVWNPDFSGYKPGILTTGRWRWVDVVENCNRNMPLLTKQLSVRESRLVGIHLTRVYWS
jgi:hypothetical protein